MPPTLALALLLSSSPLALAQTTWVVDDSGGADFTQIHAAIAAAAPGDRILVRDGSYAPFVVDRGLSVVAIEGEDVHVAEGFAVSGVPASEAATIRGLRSSKTIAVASNAGVVWLEQVTCASTGIVVREPGLRVEGSAAVVIQRSAFQGNRAVFGLLKTPGPGLSATASSVYAYDSAFLGNDGHPGWTGGSPISSTDGSAGAELDGAFLLLSGSEVIGGTGGAGDSFTWPCAPPSPGGPGIALQGGSSDVQALDATIQGGPGGKDLSGFGFCFGDVADDGPATAGGAGAITALPGRALALATDPTAPFGGALDVALSGGPAGAAAFLGLGLAPDALFVPALSGGMHVAPPHLVLALGALDGAGGLALTFAVPAFPTGVGSAVYYGQSAYVASSGAVVLGGASAVVLVDPAL